MRPWGSKSGRSWESIADSNSPSRGAIVSRYIDRICSVMLENVARSRMWTTGGGTSYTPHASSRLILACLDVLHRLGVSGSSVGVMPSSMIAILPQLSTPLWRPASWALRRSWTGCDITPSGGTRRTTAGHRWTTSPAAPARRVLVDDRLPQRLEARHAADLVVGVVGAEVDDVRRATPGRPCPGCRPTCSGTSSPVSCRRYVVTFAGCIGHSWVGARAADGRTLTHIASP
jgi:hypothetical protein